MIFVMFPITFFFYRHMINVLYWLSVSVQLSSVYCALCNFYCYIILFFKCVHALFSLLYFNVPYVFLSL